MNYLDDYDFEKESLHERAVRKLIDKHREEYEELTGRFNAERIEELERQIVRLQTEIVAIRGQNPNGTLVPALEQTANALAKENDELVKTNRKLTTQLSSTKKQLDDIKKAVREKVPA